MMPREKCTRDLDSYVPKLQRSPAWRGAFGGGVGRVKAGTTTARLEAKSGVRVDGILSALLTNVTA
ncbi:hypothetical protein E2C01_075411 [Portunus trituberculatus]|uniref:Uncharacterized protein n=1 Tax=Portunus trituberculatus TaxID=210409 RepID=A0A5B7IJ29_PORTR|nr:hypothetical protein [Portunus trituberculatus]